VPTVLVRSYVSYSPAPMADLTGFVQYSGPCHF
jgi:hypothetical protein